MTDETEEPGTTRPGGGSSAASAARRARRIGGRPSPTVAGAGRARAAAPDTAPPAGAAPAPTASTPAAPAKSAEPAAKPAKPAKPTKGTPGTSAKVTAAAATAKVPSLSKASAEPADGERVVVTQVPGWLLWLPATVLAAVALVFAIAIGVTAHGVWYAEPSTNSARDEVLAAAKTCVAATNSYKYTTITADERNGLKCTTGTWTTNYRKAMEQILIPSSKTLKSIQVAQINAAGVQSVQSHGSVWKLLVFGQVSVTSVNQKTARPDPFSAVVTMQKSGGKWKVADIDQVLKPIKTSG